jgi:hypothetical protein
MRCLMSLCCVLIPLVACGAEARPEPTFEAQVRPILKAHCWQCHGEEEQPEAGFDARLARFLVKGGESGPAVVAGNHAESLLYQRVAAGEMPPSGKKLSAADQQVIARWIDAGAKTARPEPEALAAGDLYTDEERSHWAFQPVRRPNVPVSGTLPSVQDTFSPIDAFLLARLEQAAREDTGRLRSRLAFGAEADRATLIRRLTFDLTGLPPTPDAVARFIDDAAPDAYERLVDELLASPAYGERWARHWLDVAGYADSDGYSEKDLERKWAYKYRDYVIRSLNADKPWNRFLIEQIAGDELLTPPYANLTPDEADCLIATGFLRMGPDGTGDGGVDQNVARNEVVAETIKIVSTSVLGVTVGCAQCHNHRYDPIAQTDYYRLRALFEPAYDWKNWRAPNARLVSLWSDETRARAAAVEQELKDVTNQRLEELDNLVYETFERELAKLPEDVQPAARAARETPKKDRTNAQKELIKQYPFLNVSRGSVYLYLTDRLRGFNKKWDDAQNAVKSKRPADDYVQCLTEVPGKVSPTKLFSRGDFNQPRDDVLPGELAVLTTPGFTIPADDPALPTTGRRLAYARHLTSGHHPLTARVIVNRVWMHHFGRGLVATPGDFGILGEKPSHPELLDWLASEFVDSGWSLKHIHRLILTSRAYRQSSQRREELDAIDPENRLLGRMSVRRLEAETIRDALLAVAGQLSDKQYGPPAPVAPDEVGQIIVAADNRDSAGRPVGKRASIGEEEFRRSVYVQVRRSMPLGVLEPFDAPVMTPNCEKRASSTVAPQSLLMMNSPFVIEQAAAMADRVKSQAGDDASAQFRLAWQLAFGRDPSDAELQQGTTFLSEQTTALASFTPSDPKAAKPDPSRLALANLCQALVSSNAFLYVE